MSGTQIEEIGGEAALSIASAGRTLNLASTGFRASGSFNLGKGLRLVPRVALGWQWAGGDLGTWQQSRFKGNGARFDIIAAPVESSGLDVDAGVELAFGRMSIAAEYRRNEVLREVGDGAHISFRMFQHLLPIPLSELSGEPRSRNPAEALQKFPNCRPV